MLTLVVTLVLVLVVSTSGVDDDGLPDCGDGSCPNALAASSETAECGLWLGPSPIKQAEEHGFGLGLFTGRLIRKGSNVEQLYARAGGELLVPIVNSQSLDDQHPPLREYVWDEFNMIQVATENPHGSTFFFMPGLAAIVPCTSKNYNLQLSADSTHTNANANTHDLVHRATHHTAGAFSYRHNAAFTAVRDIVPGEELTVLCDDADFDGGAYHLATFQPASDALLCIDNNIRIEPSTRPAAGQGVFAHRILTKDTIITSTPLIPIHRKVLEHADNGEEPYKVTQQQLLLNYCFGHPDSDLLLLPYGPMVNTINHGNQPNAIIQWHTPNNYNYNNKTIQLQRRQEFHHPELLQWTAETVAETHGMGLMFDIVALHTILPDEEILLDYGDHWNEAFQAHAKTWTPKDKAYRPASTFHNDVLRRTEAEQRETPYPQNTRTMCLYHRHIQSDAADLDTAEGSHCSWSDQETTSFCIRPCRILSRTNESSQALYTVVFDPQDNDGLDQICHIETVIFQSNMPRYAIQILDAPYTADSFLPDAFRHAIGVPDGIYPETWMRKKLRTKLRDAAENNGEQFKKKKSFK